MRVVDVLAKYSDEELDRLAADKVDEVANLRLPREVLVQEIASALGSLSYVAKALAPSRPPTYAFLKLLLEAGGHVAPVAGFRDAVMARTDRLTEQAKEGSELPKTKNYELYRRILYAAWEDEGHVNRSEAQLLAALRAELGIWTREHLVLEHHPELRPIWDSPRAFEEARNHVLTTGLVLVDGESYVLPEEVAAQVRQAWDIVLRDESYRRLLHQLTGAQLRAALESAGLALSGSKEERVERVVAALVPPAEVLGTLHIRDVKELCRALGASPVGKKSELIEAIVDHVDKGRDLEKEAEEAREEEPEPAEPEPRELGPEAFFALFQRLPMDQLYDILAAAGLKRSGRKVERVESLARSRFSERTLLGHLRRADLVALCRRLDVGVSGVKAELVERLVERAGLEPRPEAAAEVGEPPQVAQEEGGASAHGDEGEERQSGHGGGHADALPRSAVSAADQGSAAPPAGLRDVQADFPELAEDEQVIVALLKDARSLTEHDIGRAAGRHGLGWFLVKAHMAELLARLARRGESARPHPQRRRGKYLGVGGRRRDTSVLAQVAEQFG